MSGSAVVPGQPSGDRPSRLRRRPDVTTVLSAVLVLPTLLGSLIVVWLVGDLLWPRQPWLLPVLWLLSGALIFIAPVERALAALVFRMRRPTQAEWARLAPLWHSVCRAAGVRGDRYDLWIEPSGGLNAYSASGRTVAVTVSALRLPPAHLEAILAHELAHHVSGHPMVLTLAWWYAIPGRLATYLIGLLARFVLIVGRIFAVFGKAFVGLVSLVVAFLVLFALVLLNFWLLLLPVLSPLLAWAHRVGEFRADRTAAGLGYAPALIDVLRLWQSREPATRRRPRLRARLLATHPSHHDRIARLQKFCGHRF